MENDKSNKGGGKQVGGLIQYASAYEGKKVGGGEPVGKKFILDYNSVHLLRFFFFTCKAALVAVSNTSLTPSLLLAEHSK